MTCQVRGIGLRHSSLCPQGSYPSKRDRHHSNCAHKEGNRGRRHTLSPTCMSWEFLQCDHSCASRKRYRYQSCVWGNQGSRRSMQRYGSLHGTWDTRASPTSHSSRIRRMSQLHVHKQMACSRKHHHSRTLMDKALDRIYHLVQNRLCMEKHTGLQLSPNQLGNLKLIRERYPLPAQS